MPEVKVTVKGPFKVRSGKTKNNRGMQEKQVLKLQWHVRAIELWENLLPSGRTLKTPICWCTVAGRNGHFPPSGKG